MQENENREKRLARIGHRKKLRRKRRIFWSFVAVLLVISAVLGNRAAAFRWGIQNTLDLMNRDNVTDLASINEEMLKDTGVKNDDVVSFLLIGADKRASWKESGRSDSCMIATIDMKHNKLKLTSLMRDMYVEVPGYGKHKFNAAYSYGGVELMYKTIVANFGITVKGYVLVDFEAFKKVIDTLGGVDVKLTSDEYNYLMKTYHRTSVLKLKQGNNRMNGTQALAYCRIRQDVKGDFGRTERQRYVISQILAAMKKEPLGKWYEMAEAVMPEMTTDMDTDAIFDYMKCVVLMGATEFEQFRIPVDGSYTNEYAGKQEVLGVDLDANIKAYNKFINEE